MGLLTLTALVGEVQSGLLNRTDLTSDATNTRIVTALNFAQARISRSHDFKEFKGFFNVNTQFTANPFNDKFLPLAPYIKHIHTAVLLDNTSSRKLIEKPWRMFDKEFPMPEALARSRPALYSRWGNTAILYPVPDQVYPVFMRVTSFPRPFNFATAPLATSDFEWKDDILIALACAYLWKSFGRADKANDYLHEAQEHFQASIKQDTDMPDMDIGIDLDTSNLGDYWSDPFQRTMP